MSLTESLQSEGCVVQKPRWAPTEDDIEQCARICHEANRAVCVANGDMSQVGWDEAPDWQRDSVRDGVKFHFEHPWAEERESHDKWMERKLREGWTYGPVKDVARKQHPCLLPRYALPQNEQVKDTLFKAICAGFAKAKREALA